MVYQWFTTITISSVRFSTSSNGCPQVVSIAGFVTVRCSQLNQDYIIYILYGVE